MKRPKYGSDIPEARLQLRGIASRLRADHGLDDIAWEIEAITDSLLTRKYSGRQAPATSVPLDADIVQGVQHYLKTTDKSQQEIAAIFNINAGRVSEIANRLRDATGKVK
jgi:predicted XRE-type DNA-binding protein